MILGCFLASSAAQDPPSSDSEGGLVNWETNVSLPPSYCQEIVNNITVLNEGLDLPEHLMEDDAIKTDQDFDVNEYFRVLDRLSIEPGYVLDYVYYNDGIGGEPVLYARKANQPAYRDYNEISAERKIDSPSAEDEYLRHIKVDGTPEGFFQLYVLQIMGGQFYLFWHANYDDYKVVCNSSDAALYLSDPITIRDASQMDFTPVVEMDNDSVRVDSVVFTKWGGFIRKSMVFRIGFPHEVLREDSQDLVPYNLGIVF
jgi:hypothetical protein